MQTAQKTITDPVSFQNVRLTDNFWALRQARNVSVTLPAEFENMRNTGHLDALKLGWKPGDPNPPHIFWESDLAKWAEAAAYALALQPDPAMQAALDETIDLLAQAQQPDGYLNAHFTVVEPDKRFANLRDTHELYCAGHLIEAGVAHYETTGSRKFLDIVARYADYIDSMFGPEEGKIHGYDGHQEIELALVRLYHATGDERYLRLSSYFIDARGTQPHFFDAEAVARGDDPSDFWAKTYEYNQSHKPVREQSVIVGHSVRALYMLSAMADLARETGDETLLAACERLYDSLTGRRMYVTGGIGSSRKNEGFTSDYDLPNDDAYAETCASIALVFWMRRMLQLDLDGKYADTMERALYNGFLSGISLHGDTFYYVNKLDHRQVAHAGEHEYYSGQRKGWFGCACCPPNIARLIASVGGYAYGQSDEAAVVHLYIAGEAQLEVGGRRVLLRQRTEYPWDGAVTLTVEPETAADFALKLRIPGWGRGYTLRVNGAAVDAPVEKGYAVVQRTWQAGDTVELALEMAVERVYSDPRVRVNRGRVALMRGPLVYCLEGEDNGADLDAVRIPRDASWQAEYAADLLGGVTVLRGEGRRQRSFGEGELYRTLPPEEEPVALTAVPYYAWSNRAPGDMLVWVRE